MRLTAEMNDSLGKLGQIKAALKDERSWLLVNAIGIGIYLVIEAWILAPRPEEDAFNGIDVLYYWVIGELPILILFLVLNLVWLGFAIKRKSRGTFLPLQVWTLACLVWFSALFGYGIAPGVGRILLIVANEWAWKVGVFHSPAHDFLTAVNAGDLEKVRTLLNSNSDLVFVRSTDMGTTPLHEAVLGDYREITVLLLNKKADVNSKDNSGMTPLHYAALRGRKEIADLLLAAKADVDAKDDGGSTPLHEAARCGSKAVAELLLAHNAEINQKSNSGVTPLGMAAIEGRKEIIPLLLAQGADCNVKDSDGMTPLHFATQNGHKDVVELLLANKADVNAKDKEDLTPMTYAVRGNYEDIEKMLRQHGAR